MTIFDDKIDHPSTSEEAKCNEGDEQEQWIDFIFQTCFADIMEWHDSSCMEKHTVYLNEKRTHSKPYVGLFKNC